MGFFLTRSKLGVWYYQRWIPSHLQAGKTVFRVSLRTKDKKAAQRRSAILSVNFDRLITTLFDSPEDFSRAMEMLYRLAADPGLEEAPDLFPWEEEEHLGIEPGTYDELLYKKGQRMKWVVQRTIQKCCGQRQPDTWLSTLLKFDGCQVTQYRMQAI